MRAMYTHIVLLSALTACSFLYGETRKVKSSATTTLEKCIFCMCYAKTGTTDIHRCGRQLITLPYWTAAGSPSRARTGRRLLAFKSCREDVNCIYYTIKKYTEQFGRKDCNSDGKFNCIDRFRIQIFKNRCVNHRIPPIFSNRFHSCLSRVSRSKGRYKRSGVQFNQDVKVDINQNVNGNNNRARQNLHLNVRGG